MAQLFWEQCLGHLQEELPSQQFNTWIRPLTFDAGQEKGQSDPYRLRAPNRFVRDWVNDKFLDRINEIFQQVSGRGCSVTLLAADVPPPAFLRQQVETVGDQVENSQPLLSPSPVSPLPSPTGGVVGGNIPNTAPVAAMGEQNLLTHPASEHSQVLKGSLQNNNHSIQNNMVGGAGLSGHPVGMGMASTASGTMAVESTAVESAAVESVAMEGMAVEGRATTSMASGSLSSAPAAVPATRTSVTNTVDEDRQTQLRSVDGGLKHRSNLNHSFTFGSFIEGKSNQLALAAARQVAENPGGSYNPMFIYGGVGLGKTHLMHAVGNSLLQQKPNAKILYLHSERFVADMVKGLQLSAMNDFKRFYRSVDALLIDDIQCFVGKDRSQEEFFHTFNALLEGGRQIILTSDRYPKEIDGLEERLKSRFGWGLTVAVEPPELETRVAILIKKASEAHYELSSDAAFFIAQKIRSNVRELEGALKRVIASANFTGRPISIELIKDSLKDLLALQDRLVTIDNIQRVVADHYKVKMSELLSKRRSRSIARPRQVAMALAKDLTNHSLPEIGEAFGGRDHTTVLHACKKVKELQQTSSEISEDMKLLLRALTT